MRTRSKLLIAAISATALLGAAVTAVSANRLEIPNSERGFRIVWSDLKVEAGRREADCGFTLEGSFERRTYGKAAGTRIGRITGLVIGLCRTGTIFFLPESFPWELTYNSFRGTLPNIEAVNLNIVGMAFRATIEGIECLGRTTSTRPARGNMIVISNEIRTFELERGAGIETSGGFFCSLPGEAHLSGNGSATVSGGTAAIRLRLI